MWPFRNQQSLILVVFLSVQKMCILPVLRIFPFVSYSIFLTLRYEYMRKNATTPPNSIPAVVTQNAYLNHQQKWKLMLICIKAVSLSKQRTKMLISFLPTYRLSFKIGFQIHAKDTCAKEMSNVSTDWSISLHEESPFLSYSKPLKYK